MTTNRERNRDIQGQLMLIVATHVNALLLMTATLLLILGGVIYVAGNVNPDALQDRTIFRISGTLMLLAVALIAISFTLLYLNAYIFFGFGGFARLIWNQCKHWYWRQVTSTAMALLQFMGWLMPKSAARLLLYAVRQWVNAFYEEVVYMRPYYADGEKQDAEWLDSYDRLVALLRAFHGEIDARQRHLDNSNFGTVAGRLTEILNRLRNAEKSWRARMA